MKKNIDIGVMIIASFVFLFALIKFVVGFGLLLQSGFISSLIYHFSVPFAYFATIPFMSLGIVIMLLGILGFFIGRGLLLGQDRARIFVLIFFGFWAVTGLFGLLIGDIFSIISFVVNSTIVWYLGFNKRVVKHFT